MQTGITSHQNLSTTDHSSLKPLVRPVIYTQQTHILSCNIISPSTNINCAATEKNPSSMPRLGGKEHVQLTQMTFTAAQMQSVRKRKQTKLR